MHASPLGKSSNSRDNLSISEQLDALKSSADELIRRVDDEVVAVREKYGDRLDLILHLTDEIEAEAKRLGLGTIIWHNRRFPEPIEGLFQQLYVAMAKPPKRWWTPGSKCECGHSITLWIIPEREYDDYRIYCEGCWASLGIENEDMMYEAVNRGEGRDLWWKDTREPRFQDYMFRKSLAEALDVSLDELPRHISRFDKRPMPELVDHVRELIEQRESRARTRIAAVPIDSTEALQSGDGLRAQMDALMSTYQENFRRAFKNLPPLPVPDVKDDEDDW